VFLLSVVKFHMPIYLDKSLTIVGDATEGTALFVTGPDRICAAFLA